jgi:hypothetical protein
MAKRSVSRVTKSNCRGKWIRSAERKSTKGKVYKVRSHCRQSATKKRSVSHKKRSVSKCTVKSHKKRSVSHGKKRSASRGMIKWKTQEDCEKHKRHWIQPSGLTKAGNAKKAYCGRKVASPKSKRLSQEECVGDDMKWIVPNRKTKSGSPYAGYCKKIKGSKKSKY